MNYNCIFAQIMLCATLAHSGSAIAAPVEYTLSYDQEPDFEWGSPYRPVAKISFNVSDDRITKLLMSSFYGHIVHFDGPYGRLYRAASSNENPQTINKIHGVSFIDGDFYEDPFARKLMRCINTIPQGEVGDPVVFEELVRLLETPIPEIDSSEITATVYRLRPAVKAVYQYYKRNNRTCPDGDPIRGRLDPIRDFNNVLEAMRGVFDFTHKGPSYSWSAVVKSIFHELVAFKGGFWFKETQNEVEDMFIIMVGDNSVDETYVRFLRDKSFPDFLSFTREMRDYLESQSNPMQTAKTIGNSCLSSLDEVYQPFSLKSCMDAGKLEAVPTGNPGTVFLVPGPSALTSTDDQGE